MTVPEKATTGIKGLRFYENWWLMAESRDTDKKRLAFYDAIMRYAFRGGIPQVPKDTSEGVVWAAWDGYNVCRPVLDGITDMMELHEKKVSAGRLGGLASGEARNEASSEASSEANDEAKTKAKRSNPYNINVNVKDKCKCKNNTPEIEARKADVEIMFVSWWKAYPGPRKYDKQKCREKFIRILMSAKDHVQTFNAIMDGLEKWKRSDVWTRDGGKFIRAPMVWLNNCNWEDAPGAATAQSGVSNIFHDPNVEVQNAF